MNRKEEIFKASADTFNACGEGFKAALKFVWGGAFIAGIQWADEHPKNKWHSIDDVPTGQYEIICKGNKAKCWHCDWEYVYENYPNWKQFVKEMNVKKWLYMHEL